MNLIFLFAAIATGAAIAMQPGINSGLAKHLGSPFQASLISFSTGAVVMLTICLARGVFYPRISQFAGLNWWQIVCGGSLGALYVTLALVLAPKVGATLFVAAVVAGQMIGSLLLDHHGLLGFKEDLMNIPKLTGGIFVVLGVALIARS